MFYRVSSRYWRLDIVSTNGKEELEKLFSSLNDLQERISSLSEEAFSQMQDREMQNIGVISGILGLFDKKKQDEILGRSWKL